MEAQGCGKLSMSQGTSTRPSGISLGCCCPALDRPLNRTGRLAPVLIDGPIGGTDDLFAAPSRGLAFEARGPASLEAVDHVRGQ